MSRLHHHSVLQRIQTTLAALPVLALLFVLLSSLSHQPTSAKPSAFGFIASLDEQTVVILTDSSRAKISKHERDPADNDDSDSSDSWCGNLSVGWADHCLNTYSLTEPDRHPRSATRFLTPLLRAPPLA